MTRMPSAVEPVVEPAVEPVAAGAPPWSGPIAILAPAGRDAPVAARVLARAGFSPYPCADMDALCAALAGHIPAGPGEGADAGDGAGCAMPEGVAVGALVIAEEALAGPARERLLAALAAQPAWSDVTLVVLTGEGELSRALSPALEALVVRANVTLLERPVRVATLVTALRAALRARRRQLDLRDHLAERAVAEAALRAARVEAEEACRAAEAASRAKGEFLAVMSHELRTPLNAIAGYVQLLDMGLHGPVTDDQRGALGRVQRAQQHLLGLINDVLNYAKLESGHVEYDVRAVDVADVVRDVAPLIEPQLHAKGLALDVRLPDAPCVVEADREKLGQVLVNLLTNAVKFTDSPDPRTGIVGRVTIEVATRAGGEASDVPGVAPEALVFLRVRDTGRGVPREKQDAIFEPFVQVRAGTGSAYAQATAGTGLGLSISRDLARGMGGDLRVRSAEGAGAAFTVALRRMDDGEAAAGGHAAPAAP